MDVPEIDVDELARRRDTGVVLVDVRMPDEYEQCHVPGATLVPLPELPDHIGDMPRDDTVHVICAGGGRSRRAAEFLNANGYEAVNIAGGTKAWLEAGYPVATGRESES